MQDRYTGDIGDFGKYALLKALGGSGLRLGIVWYLNPDEESNQDGGFVSYPQLRECDPLLYDSLGEIVRDGDRRVVSIEASAILPEGTLFYKDPLTFRDLPGYPAAARRARRAAWVQRALDSTAAANLIFVDPDNGLAGTSASATSNTGQKYVFLEELGGYAARGQSLIVYHHQTRERGGLLRYVERQLSELRKLGSAMPWALIFRRRSVRVYFVIPAPEHTAMLEDRTRLFLSGIWGRRGHFEMAPKR